MEIDEKILQDLRNVTREEKETMLKMISLNRKEPGTIIALATLREIMVFRMMCEATILGFKRQQEDLARRIERFEHAIESADEEHDCPCTEEEE